MNQLVEFSLVIFLFFSNHVAIEAPFGRKSTYDDYTRAMLLYVIVESINAEFKSNANKSAVIFTILQEKTSAIIMTFQSFIEHLCL